MQVKRTSIAALTLASAMVSGCLYADIAEARGKCASGQILRVSSGTCVSREAAIEQGIIGGKRGSQPAATTPQEPETDSTAAAETETTTVEKAAPAPAPKPVKRQAHAPRQQQEASSEPAPQAAASGVRIEVVKTKPQTTPEILTPTWPYGELAAFPRRVTP